MTIESVSARSGMGKPTIYRYWPNRLAVAIDALAARMASEVPPAGLGDARSPSCSSGHPWSPSRERCGGCSQLAARRPRLRGALERPASWVLRHGSRLVRRPVADPGQAIKVWAGRLGELRLSPAGWMKVTGWAVANWLADAGVLAVSILAVGAAVPWPDLLLAYNAGIAAQSFSVTPGGLGVTEGTLSLALVATGMHAMQALAAACFTVWSVSGWLLWPAG